MLLCIVLEYLENARHVIDRIFALLGARTVGGMAACVAPPTKYAFVGYDDVQQGRFGYDDRVRGARQ
jgi:hypothetical protein